MPNLTTLDLIVHRDPAHPGCATGAGDGGQDVAMALRRVVSGGQSGVDRAALDAALALGLPYGGWCPAGGRAEDHPQPPGLLASYPHLRETCAADSAVRTRANVLDSDATLVLVPREGRHSPGTAWTIECCRELGRPHLVASVDQTGAVAAWLGGLPDGAVLNVAGPRESQAPGVYDAVRALLAEVLDPHPPP